MHQTHPDWPNKILPKTRRLIETMEKLIQGIASLSQDIHSLKNGKLNEMVDGILFEINAIANRLINTASPQKLFGA